MALTQTQLFEDAVPCPFNRQWRSPHTSLVVFGEDHAQDRWSVLCFDSDMQKEERAADMEKREYASYSVVAGRIFVVGGSTAQQEYSNCVDEFSLRERRWQKRAPLATGRRLHAAAVVEAGEENTLIGVFGGCDGSGNLSSCEVFDVRQDRWSKLPDLREKSSGPAAACLPGDSRIFVFGGWNGSSWLASVEFCQLGADWAAAADFWLPAAPMRTARRGLAATAFRERILVAGGNDGGDYFNVVEAFRPPDARCPHGQWTELAGMEQPRILFTLLTSANVVYAFGQDVGEKNTVETPTAPEDSADSGNDLTSWRWSSKDPVETLSWIVGAASLRI